MKNDSVKLKILLTAILVVASVTFFSKKAYANGDSILHLGATGYADLADASVSDLDYSRDFSVEAEVNIDAYREVGRWANIIGKTTVPYNATSGFSLCFAGYFDTFGQQIYAKVGDGTSSVTIQSPKFYQGQTHVALSWNASGKTMKLYVNGELIDTKTNASIVPANIENTRSLNIGAASSYLTLQKDIFFARLWNRELSAGDADDIFDNFTAKGQHALPAGVSGTDLKSEWLMQEASDATGNSGTTHIKDTAGSNHLLTQGGAAIEKGNGNLALAYPANGSAGISSAVVLKASGGAGTLGTPATDPLWYSFQIDENSNFDSSDLKSSGWQSGSAEWKPVLKPGKTYYWRAKVKNSADSPTISAYTSHFSFATRAAKNWYIRPNVYDGTLIRAYIPKSVPGTYGTEDGNSYSNAWNGIRNTVWGENGVSAGDDLYVCGRHLLTINSSSFFTQWGKEYVKESGYSEDYPVTIRMDCPGDEGTLLGIFKDERTAVTWSGPDANGVYSTTNLPYGAAAEIKSDGTLIWLEGETSATWTGHQGARYFSGGTTYVKTSDGSSPNGKIYSPGFGFNFDLGRTSHVKFYKANILGTGMQSERISKTITSTPPSHHISIIDSKLGHVAGTLVALRKGNDNWTVRNSDLGNASEGIYAYGDEGAGANFLTIQDTKIHDIGTTNYPSGDCHCIGVQGGEGHVFERNELWNGGGSAIEFWTYDQPMKNMTVRYNYIHDIYVRCVTSGGGISVSGDNVASVEGLRTGYKIHHNIIQDIALDAPAGWWGGSGIGANNKDPMEVYNNVIINPRTSGFGVTVVGSGVAQGSYYNNIVVNPRQGKFISFISPSAPTNLFVDNNLFYPANSNDITSNTTAFTVYPFVAHDTNSVFADPQFVSADLDDLADFALRATSPAIDAGRDAGIAKDIAGTNIPKGLAPDIGVFEKDISAADLNLDSLVNLTDFNILKADFLRLTANLSNSRSDIDGDGQATVKDVGILMSGWGP